MLKIKDKFLDHTEVLRTFDPQYLDDIKVEIYTVGVPMTIRTYSDIDIGIILKIKGKEIYRNYKLHGYTIKDIVRKIQKDLMNESLNIR
jgi:hypothetical protein